MRTLLAAFLLLGLGGVAQTLSWQDEVRSAASRSDLKRALTLVEARLSTNPTDLEAHGWHARILGWNGHWEAAETEYRGVLQQAPNDVDILAGLADVLLWQARPGEALAVLDRAVSLAPNQPELLNRRGRALLRLGRSQEATREYQAVLRLVPGDKDANQALGSLGEDHRHELRLGVDTDTFNYADAAAAESITLTSRWNSLWTTSFSTAFSQRFGAGAQRMTGRVSRRLGQHSWVALGVGAGHDDGIIPRREAGFEYGRGFRLSGRLVRGAEVSYSQQWLWYRDSRLLVVGATGLLYLPRDWTFTLNLAGIRTALPVVGVEWQPAGSARLAFPVRGRLRGNAFFAIGTENFARADQIGRFSAHTYGGGLRYQFTRTQDIGAYVSYQCRTLGRTDTAFGLTYGIRF